MTYHINQFFIFFSGQLLPFVLSKDKRTYVYSKYKLNNVTHEIQILVFLAFFFTIVVLKACKLFFFCFPLKKQKFPTYLISHTVVCYPNMAKHCLNNRIIFCWVLQNFLKEIISLHQRRRKRRLFLLLELSLQYQLVLQSLS